MPTHRRAHRRGTPGQRRRHGLVEVDACARPLLLGPYRRGRASTGRGSNGGLAPCGANVRLGGGGTPPEQGRRPRSSGGAGTCRRSHGGDRDGQRLAPGLEQRGPRLGARARGPCRRGAGGLEAGADGLGTQALPAVCEARSRADRVARAARKSDLAQATFPHTGARWVTRSLSFGSSTAIARRHQHRFRAAPPRFWSQTALSSLHGLAVRGMQRPSRRWGALSLAGEPRGRVLPPSRPGAQVVDVDSDRIHNRDQLLE